MKAEIISIGTEILLGEITDTNASFLASQLPQLGIELLWVSQVGDNQIRLVQALKQAWERAELVLTTGGLGPTGDDITRESVAEMLGEQLTLEPALEKALRERFGLVSTSMPPSNLKQASIIKSARAIPNPNGTAPGWVVEKDGRILIAMPGPPAEMQPMWRDAATPLLAKRSGAIILTRTIKTSGLTEGAVGELVNPMFASENPVLGVYAKQDGIHLRLAAKGEDRKAAEKLLSEGENSIRAVLGKYIWGIDDETIGVIIGRLLVQKKMTLALMEDFSGGWLAANINDIQDSRSYFKGGLIAPTDEAKKAFGVEPEVIQQFGSVSPETAQAMAKAARILLKSDVGIGITASKETKERPMGITYIGISGDNNYAAAISPRRRQNIVSSTLFELRKWLMTPVTGERSAQ